MIHIKAKVNPQLLFTDGYLQGINFMAKNTLKFLKDESSDEQTRLSNAIRWCEDSIKIHEESKMNNIKSKKENT